MTDLYIVKVTGPRWLNANDRIHWAPKAKATKQWRDNATWAVKAAHVPRVQGKAHIIAVLLFPDRRRRDPANWYPTVKACIDGLVPAVLVDDDVAHLSGPDMRSRVHPGIKAPTVELHISEVAP